MSRFYAAEYIIIHDPCHGWFSPKCMWGGFRLKMNPHASLHFAETENGCRFSPFYQFVTLANVCGGTSWLINNFLINRYNQIYKKPGFNYQVQQRVSD